MARSDVAKRSSLRVLALLVRMMKRIRRSQDRKLLRNISDRRRTSPISSKTSTNTSLVLNDAILNFPPVNKRLAAICAIYHDLSGAIYS